MALLTNQEIYELYTAACTLGLVNIRDSLLAGIDKQFVGTLRTSPYPAGQLLLDLQGLNDAGTLLGETVPLATWLSNADVLSHPRAESRVFKHFLARLKGIPEPPVSIPPGGDGTPVPEKPSIANRLSSWALPGASLVVTAIIAKIVFDSSKSWQVTRASGEVVQLVFVLGVSIATWWRDEALIPRGSKKADHCKSCVDHVNDYWRLLWFSWILFYALHSGRQVVQRIAWGTGASPWWWAVGVPWFFNFMHTFQAVLLLMLFRTMVRPKEKGSSAPRDDLHRFGWMMCVLFSMGEAIVLYSIQHGGGPEALRAAQLWPALIVGVFAATCLAMLVGTLESVFLDVGEGELIVLYAYAAIQPLFRLTTLGEFDKDLHDDAHVIDLVLKALALAFKLGLYVVIRRQIVGGRLAFYMWNVRDLPDAKGAEWQAFKRGPLAAKPASS